MGRPLKKTINASLMEPLVGHPRRTLSLTKVAEFIVAKHKPPKRSLHLATKAECGIQLTLVYEI